MTFRVRPAVMESRSRTIGATLGALEGFPSVGFGTGEIFATWGAAWAGGGAWRSHAGSAISANAKRTRLTPSLSHRQRQGDAVKFGRRGNLARSDIRTVDVGDLQTQHVVRVRLPQ